VGCTTPPTPDPDPDPTPTPVVVISSTPVLTAVESSVNVSIVDVTSTSTQYVNKAEAGSSILVKGTAPVESLVKVYLGGVAISTVAETSVTGLWTIAIAKSSLGVDGVKVMTAKVTEVGLAESVASNAVTFTLDTVRPSASTLAATADTTAVVATCPSATFSGTNPIAAVALSGTTGVALVAGTWYVECLGASGVADNVVITSPSSTQVTYAIAANQVLINAIPGVTLTFKPTFVLNDAATVIVRAAVVAIPDRATVLFSEEISSVSAMALANYTWGNSTTGTAPVDTPIAYGSLTTYFTLDNTLARFDAISCLVNGAVDLAGNIQTTASTLTCIVGAASLTSLTP